MAICRGDSATESGDGEYFTGGRAAQKSIVQLYPDIKEDMFIQRERAVILDHMRAMASLPAAAGTGMLHFYFANPDRTVGVGRPD